jgi:hypothetical protein
MHGFANVMSCQALPSRWQEGARGPMDLFSSSPRAQGFSTYNRFPWCRKRKHHRGYLLEAGSSLVAVGPVGGDPFNDGRPETQFEFCDYFNPFVTRLTDPHHHAHFVTSKGHPILIIMDGKLPACRSGGEARAGCEVLQALHAGFILEMAGSTA